MTARAKVILKKSKTYIFEGRRWIQNVPGIVNGDDKVKAYKENGFFHTTVLKSKKPKSEAKGEAKGKDDKKSKHKGKLKK